MGSTQRRLEFKDKTNLYMLLNVVNVTIHLTLSRNLLGCVVVELLLCDAERTELASSCIASSCNEAHS